MDASIVSGLKETVGMKTRRSKEIASSRIGVGFEMLDREMFKPERCYALLGASGVKHARCQTGWRRCEKEKGKFDFAWLDDVVDKLLEQGVEPWFNVGYGNKLYMPGVDDAAVGCMPLLYGEETAAAWKRFSTELARHFKGRVKTYEVWNEANHNGFWRPGKSDPKEYVNLVEVTAKALKAGDESVETTACCAGANSMFILDCFRFGVGKTIKAFAIHPYSNLPEFNYAEGIAALRAQAAKYAPGVEIWQGECGCPSKTYDHNDVWLDLFNMDETKQAKWLLRRLLTDLSLGLERTSYFHACDPVEALYMQATGPRPPVVMGLLRGKTYEPKPAFQTFSGVCALFDAKTKASALSIHSYGKPARCGSKLAELAVKKLTFEREGFPLYAYYLPEDLQLETPVKFETGLRILDDAEKRLEEPVLIDLLQMKVFDVADARRSSDWAFASFENMPLADYPLILSDRKTLETI